MNLKKIISQGESETVEFKKSLSESKEIVETISAFANTIGGRPKITDRTVLNDLRDMEIIPK